MPLDDETYEVRRRLNQAVLFGVFILIVVLCASLVGATIYSVKADEERASKAAKTAVTGVEQLCQQVRELGQECAVEPESLKTGAQGPPGPQGPRGEPGQAGQNGLNGATGAEGANGRDGLDGEPGPQGEPGPSGPAGADGADGSDGADGAPGPQGPQGSDGKPPSEWTWTDPDSVSYRCTRVAGSTDDAPAYTCTIVTE